MLIVTEEVLQLQDSPPGDVWFHKTQHVEGGFVELDEGGVVDLTETEQLKDLAYPRAHSIDTAHTHTHTQVM